MHAGCAMQDFADCQHSFETYAIYKIIDLISAHKLLQTAAEDIAQFRRSFDAVLNEVSIIAFTWGSPRQFLTFKTPMIASAAYRRTTDDRLSRLMLHNR